jgi:hypothetical protein
VLEVPTELCHYYDEGTGPFRSLSDLPPAAAEELLGRIRAQGETFASRRPADYVRVRFELEARVRALFVERGGHPLAPRPHYLTLGPCPWLLGWYRTGRELRIRLADVDSAVVSFTYGDLFPAMRYPDGLEHSGRVFRLEELPELIGRFGLPQLVNPDGARGPKRYIEAQLWDDEVVGRCAAHARHGPPPRG